MSGIWPYRWTTMTARVRGLIAAASVAGVIRSVSSLTSAKRGVAPARTIAAALAMNVLAGTMTSSPGPMPSAVRVSCSASVPFATATAYSVPQKRAQLRSKDPTAGPPIYRPRSTESR